MLEHDSSINPISEGRGNWTGLPFSRSCTTFLQFNVCFLLLCFLLVILFKMITKGSVKMSSHIPEGQKYNNVSYGENMFRQKLIFYWSGIQCLGVTNMY